LTKLQNETLRLSAKSAAVRRGGKAEFQGINTLADMPSDQADDGVDVDSINVNTFKDMLSAFVDEAKDVSGLKEMHKYILDAFFNQGKSYEEMLNDRPDLFPGKTLSNVSTIVSVLLKGNKRIPEIAKNIGPKFGFPSSWLTDLLDSKNLKRVRDIFNTSTPKEKETGSHYGEKDSYISKEKVADRNALIYEKKKK